MSCRHTDIYFQYETIPSPVIPRSRSHGRDQGGHSSQQKIKRTILRMSEESALQTWSILQSNHISDVGCEWRVVCSVVGYDVKGSM